MRKALKCLEVFHAFRVFLHKAFKEAIEKKAGVLVDVRNMLAFGGGHIAGALNIAGTPILSIWAGWLLDPEEPILLVLEEDDDLEKILRLFVRTGYTKFAGYLIGGMKAWHAAGFPLERIGQMGVHELNERKSSLQIVDVRSPGEWKKGRVPGAHHIFVPELGKRMAELDRNKPTAIYCGSGYRASIATSILKQQGFNELWNVPGSWEAWKKAKLQLRERTANERNYGVTPAFFRGDDARRYLVDPSAARLSRIVDFYRVLHVGRVSGKGLFLWQLHFAVLFAGTVRRFAA